MFALRSRRHGACQETLDPFQQYECDVPHPGMWYLNRDKSWLLAANCRSLIA
jgi:hypothetical protein